MARLRIEGTAKAIAVFAVLLIVSTGLCGMTWQAAWTGTNGGGYLIFLGIVASLGMLVGLVGFLGSITAAILQAFRRRSGADNAGTRLGLTDDNDKGDKR